MRRGKQYKEKINYIDKNKQYLLEEALEAIKTMPHSNFDETVEIAFKLGVDPRKSEQNVRGAVTLPKGTGQKVRVAVIATGEKAEQARKAGADFVGMEDMIESIQKGWLEFDSLIASTEAMPKVRRLGKILGPKGLMPNPKTGTVTDDLANAVKDAKAGKVEFRVDRTSCIHLRVGKVSFSKEDLYENCQSVMQALYSAKPTAAKGTYIKSCSVCSTMSPGIKVNTTELAKMVT